MRLMTLTMLIVMLTGCGDEEPATVPTDKSAGVTLEPVATFAAQCARCHGPGGAYYARPFQNEGDQLRVKVEEMMRGPAALNPTEADIDAMMEYHLSMRGQSP